MDAIIDEATGMDALQALVLELRETLAAAQELDGHKAHIYAQVGNVHRASDSCPIVSCLAWSSYRSQRSADA